VRQPRPLSLGVRRWKLIHGAGFDGANGGDSLVLTVIERSFLSLPITGMATGCALKLRSSLEGSEVRFLVICERMNSNALAIKMTQLQHALKRNCGVRVARELVVDQGDR